MTNILTTKEDHRTYCTRTSAAPVAEVGDVRFCNHGRVMLAYSVRGVIGPYWRTLSPVFNPVLYRRAKRALRGVSEASRGVTEVLVDEAKKQWTPLSEIKDDNPTTTLSDMAGELVTLVDGPKYTYSGSRTLYNNIHEAAEAVLNSRFGTDSEHTMLANVIAENAVFSTPIPWSISRKFDPPTTPKSE